LIWFSLDSALRFAIASAASAASFAAASKEAVFCILIRALFLTLFFCLRERYVGCFLFGSSSCANSVGLAFTIGLALLAESLF